MNSVSSLDSNFIFMSNFMQISAFNSTLQVFWDQITHKIEIIQVK